MLWCAVLSIGQQVGELPEFLRGLLSHPLVFHYTAQPTCDRGDISESRAVRVCSVQINLTELEPRQHGGDPTSYLVAFVLHHTFLLARSLHTLCTLGYRRAFGTCSDATMLDHSTQCCPASHSNRFSSSFLQFVPCTRAIIVRAADSTSAGPNCDESYPVFPRAGTTYVALSSFITPLYCIVHDANVVFIFECAQLVFMPSFVSSRCKESEDAGEGEGGKRDASVRELFPWCTFTQYGTVNSTKIGLMFLLGESTSEQVWYSCSKIPKPL